MVSMLAFVPALGAEPNEANAPQTELKFEIRSEDIAWRNKRNDRGVGPIKPTHVAKFFKSGSYYYLDLADPREVKRALGSSAGRSVSARQREFLATSDAFVYGSFGDVVRNHRQYLLYAVSQEDAKKMAQAFMELVTEEANSRMQEEKNELREGEAKIAQAKQRLPEAEAELEAITVEYQSVKKTTHPLSSDEDGAKQAKDTILEMDKILDSLNIQITGIRAKLSAVEQYRSKKNISAEGLAKLEQILSEQTVELAGALARKGAALEISKQEQEFCRLAKKWASLEAEVKDLRKSLPDWEQWCRDKEEELVDPAAGLLPPKLYQNKVTIHPVDLNVNVRRRQRMRGKGS
jgi:myosin heavy subunit